MAHDLPKMPCFMQASCWLDQLHCFIVSLPCHMHHISEIYMHSCYAAGVKHRNEAAQVAAAICRNTSICVTTHKCRCMILQPTLVVASALAMPGIQLMPVQHASSAPCVPHPLRSIPL